jgi:hypothetical protein
MLIAIMPDLTPLQARELLVAYDYHLEILVPMLLELQEQPPPKKAPDLQGAAASPAPQPCLKQVTTAEPTTSLVELVIYDLQPDRSFAKTVGLGAFHSAVVLYGVEISFGGTLDAKADKDMPGIWSTHRKYCAAAAVKSRLLLGETQVSRAELREMLVSLGASEWRLRDYHLLAKNCNHFTDTLLRRIGQRSVKLSVEQFEAALEDDAAANGKRHDGRGAPLPRLTLPDDYFDEKKRPTAVDVFKLPGWVNRAAKLGDKVVPDFIFAKILEKLMPPVAEDQDQDDTPPPSATSAPAARAFGQKMPPPVPPISRPPPSSAAAATAPPLETPAEAAAVCSIADVIGADAKDPAARTRILAVLRSCGGDADLAVARLL